MDAGVETITQQRLETVQRLLQNAEQAYFLARQLQDEIARVKAAEQGPKLTPLGYALGICLGDAESSASRLGGLRGELLDLVGTLERQAHQAHAA